MRVLFFNYEYPPLGGGAGNASFYLLREYAARPELEVDFVTASVDDRYHRETLGEGRIRIHRLPIGKDQKHMTHQSSLDLVRYTWAAGRFAEGLAREHRYDCVHAFFTVPCGYLAYRLKRRHGLPYIVSLRGADVPGYSDRFTALYAVLRPLIRRIWRQAAAVISNSQGLRTLALRSAPSQEIGVIRNGVDTAEFSPGESELRDAGRFTVLAASRLNRRKGFRYALDGFAAFWKKFPAARLLIAGGDGGAEAELKEQAAALSLGQAVSFVGHIPHANLPRYYRAADVFLFPSLNEGMSNNLLEALASGLPVVMTPTGGAEELIRDGENGYLVRFRDAAHIADKLAALAADPERRRRMGETSRRLAETLDWRLVADAYLEAYRSAAKR